MSGGETRCTTCGVQLIDRDHRPWCENRVRRTAEVYLPDPPAAVFTAASRFVRRFVSTHKHAQHVAVLWVAHCHAIDAFYTTPGIRIESPEPECGKTGVSRRARPPTTGPDHGRIDHAQRAVPDSRETHPGGAARRSR